MNSDQSILFQTTERPPPPRPSKDGDRPVKEVSKIADKQNVNQNNFVAEQTINNCDPFGMSNDESVWQLPPQPSAANHINGKDLVAPFRQPEKTPLPSQFALSNEHLVNIGDQPYEDLQEFKMATYDPNEKAVCDSENSSDAASSSEDESNVSSLSTVKRTHMQARPIAVEVRPVADPYDVDGIAEVCGSHQQHLDLASNDYQRLAESTLSMNVAPDQLVGSATGATAVKADESDEESLR